MAKYKIEISDGCIGCSNCAGICPDSFEMKDGKAEVKKAEADELGCAKEAAENCPADVIHITDTEKNEKIV